MISTSNQKPKIILIGGAEISIENKPIGQLQFGPENPGTISVYCRGKAWTLALDLLADGCHVDFVSVAGNDFSGQAMKAQLYKLGIGVDHFHLIDGKDTAARHEIMNLLDQPEMEFQNCEVFDSMTTEMIESATDLISAADCIVLETRFPQEVLEYVASTFSQKPILLLPDSPDSAAKAASILGEVKGILTGRREAEILSGLIILSEEELQIAGEWFFEKGIGQVFFDLGFGGVYFKDRLEAGAKRPGPGRIACIVEGFVENQSAAQSAEDAINKR